MSRVNIATRRALLTQGLGLVGVGSVVPNFLIRAALAGPRSEPGQQVTVVLQLAGGHDGLSALVPYGHKDYYEHRKETAIEEKEVLKINEQLGLHPNLHGWKQLLDAGELAAIPGVGYPNPNFSHFTATDIWFAGDPGEADRRLSHGWVGRAMDEGFAGVRDPLLSVAVGTGSTPWALIGSEHPGLCFHRPESFRYVGDRNDAQRADLYRRLNEVPSPVATRQLDWVSGTAMAANAASEQIRQLASQYKPQAEYPETGLGRNLQIIAGLICGGLSTRVYWTAIGGFDTHGNQRTQHDKLMKTINDATVAFFDDLKQQQQARRVLLFTMSEFSRTTKENGSKGTDHAAAGTHFMIGPGVKAGIHGEHPSLAEDDLLRSGWSLQHNTDFRSLYATVMEKWLDIPSQPVLGQQWPLIDCVA